MTYGTLHSINYFYILGDESVVLKANEITKIVLLDLINDPNTQALTSKFVMDILRMQQVQQSVIDLVQVVIQDHALNEKVNELVVRSLKSLLANEETSRLLKDYIRVLLMDEEITKSCQLLLNNLSNDPYTKEILGEFFKRVIASEPVTNQAIMLGKTVTKDILNDQKIQKDTGDALWNAGWYSITPKWFSR